MKSCCLTKPGCGCILLLEAAAPCLYTCSMYHYACFNILLAWQLSGGDGDRFALCLLTPERVDAWCFISRIKACLIAGERKAEIQHRHLRETSLFSNQALCTGGMAWPSHTLMQFCACALACLANLPHTSDGISSSKKQI